MCSIRLWMKRAVKLSLRSKSKYSFITYWSWDCILYSECSHANFLHCKLCCQYTCLVHWHTFLCSVLVCLLIPKIKSWVPDFERGERSHLGNGHNDLDSWRLWAVYHCHPRIAPPWSFGLKPLVLWATVLGLCIDSKNILSWPSILNFDPFWLPVDLCIRQCCACWPSIFDPFLTTSWPLYCAVQCLWESQYSFHLT